jgi:hypothetical protein
MAPPYTGRVCCDWFALPSPSLPARRTPKQLLLAFGAAPL